MKNKQKIMMATVIAATVITGMTVFAEGSGNYHNQLAQATASNAETAILEEIDDEQEQEIILATPTDSLRNIAIEPRSTWDKYNYNNQFEYREGFSWYYNDYGIIIENWTATSSNAIVEVPAEIDNLPVVDIKVYQPNPYIEKLILPDSLNIGHSRFSGLTALKEINIPSSTRVLESYAFERCISLEKVVFNSNANLDSILHMAFFDCDSLREITLPSTIEWINYSSFWSRNLQNLFIEEGGTEYIDIDGVLCRLPNSLYGIYHNPLTIEYIPTGRTGDYIVPDQVEALDIKALPTYQLDRIIIKNRNTYITQYTSSWAFVLNSIPDDMHLPIIVCYEDSQTAQWLDLFGLPYEFIDETNYPKSSKTGSSGKNSSYTTSSTVKETTGT